MGRVDLSKRKAVKKGAKPAAKQIPASKEADNKLVTIPRGGQVATKQSITDMLLEDAGSGMELMKASNFAIPRLAILQSLSPQCVKANDLFIEGAEAGMIYDSVSGELYDGEEGLNLLFITFRYTHLQWWPRSSKKGKGFIADLGANEACLKGTTKDDKFANLLPDGSEIVPTAEYFCFIINDDGTHTKILLSMAKTQLKKSKQLNTLSQILVNGPGGKKVLAPLFYRSYRVTVVPESKGDNNWFGWKIEPGECLLDNDLGLPVMDGGDDIYLEARAFKMDIAAGKVNVQAPGEHAGDDHADGGGRRSGRDDDAPM